MYYQVQEECIMQPFRIMSCLRLESKKLPLKNPRMSPMLGQQTENKLYTILPYLKYIWHTWSISVCKAKSTSLGTWSQLEAKQLTYHTNFHEFAIHTIINFHANDNSIIRHQKI